MTSAWSLLYIAGVAFVFWVLFKDGRGFRFHPLGLFLSATMVVLLPFEVIRGSAPLFDIGLPAVVRWLAPVEGFVVAVAITVLISRPQLMGTRPGKRTPPG